MSLLRTLMVVLSIAGLAACGGGDPDPDPGHVPPPTPVDCKKDPKLCE